MQTDFNDNKMNEGNNRKFTLLDYTNRTDWLNRTKNGVDTVTIETTKSVQQEREGKTNEEMAVQGRE